jgi:type IX secretion system substrate protein
MFNLSDYEISPITKIQGNNIKIQISNNILSSEIREIPKKGYSIMMFNFAGKKILTKSGEKEDKKLILDLKEMDNGLYLLRIEENKDNRLIQSYSIKKI